MSNHTILSPFLVAVMKEIFRGVELVDYEERDFRDLERPELQVPISNAGLKTALVVTLGTSIEELSDLETQLAAVEKTLTPAMVANRIMKAISSLRSFLKAIGIGEVFDRFVCASRKIALEEQEPHVHPPRLVVLAIMTIREKIDFNTGLFRSSAPDRRPRLKLLREAASAAYGA